VVANSAAGSCPLSGPIWGEGNILLGGAGSDTITGRGADDIIDGDRALSVRISVRTNPADAATEIGSADLMEHQYLRDGTGALTGATLQAAVFKGTVDPSNLVIVREIDSAPKPNDIDTAAFSGPSTNYTVVTDANKVTVTQTGANVVGQKVSDGIDTLRNVEVLKFTDKSVTIAPTAALSATSQDFGVQRVGVTSAARTVTLSNTGITPLAVSAITVTGPNAGDFTIPAGTCTTVPANGTCSIPVRFGPATAGAKTATLQVTSNSGGTPGTVLTVALKGLGAVNSPATGSPVVHDPTPEVGQTLRAVATSIADANGLTPFTYTWEGTPNLNPNGTPVVLTLAGGAPATGTSRDYVVRLVDLGRRIRVRVTFVDQLGFSETLVGPLTTGRVGLPVAGGQTPLPAVTVPPSLVAPIAPALGAPSPAAGPAPAVAAAPAALRAAGLAVLTGGPASPITVQATVPPGATTVQIAVFRLTGRRARAAAQKKVARRHVATVYRTVATSKRYRFSLTEKVLRNLSPGTYQVEVRVGKSRTALGPAMTRTFVRKAKVRGA
jgi:hypothetical protein